MPTPIRNPKSPIRNRRAFSLVEILVVIGILAGLIAVVLPMINKARKSAARTRQASDFQAIAMALEAYKQDFGDYPRAFAPGAGFVTLGYALIAPGPKLNSGTTLNPPTAFNGGTHYEGGEVVNQGGNTYAAIAHNENGTAPPDVDHWASAPWQDGADGPGFRLRAQGQTHGPYLQPDKFKVRNYAILDLWGNPILYFPARAGSVNPSQPQSYMWDSRDTTLSPQGAKPLYNFVDNICILEGQLSVNTPDKANMAKILYPLGDYNPSAPTATTNGDGQIGQGESAAMTGPFILWSAGADQEGNHEFEYGLNADGKTDDVTNFDIPIGFLKK
jgi:type II secretory pathway pseudopilin PulG